MVLQHARVVTAVNQVMLVLLALILASPALPVNTPAMVVHVLIVLQTNPR